MGLFRILFPKRRREEPGSSNISAQPLIHSDLCLDDETKRRAELSEAIEDMFSYAMRSPEFNVRYEQLLRAVYESPYIYVALSRNGYDEGKASSSPVVLTKDRDLPTLYIFTNWDNAKTWCEHYQFYNESVYFLGILYKNPSDFQSLYCLADLIGVRRIMVNEGGRYLNFAVKELLETCYVQDTTADRLGEELYASYVSGNGIELPKLNVIARRSSK